MLNFLKKIAQKSGLSPGTLVYVGEEKTELGEIQARLFNLTSKGFEEKTLTHLEECIPYLKDPGLTWINLSGLHNISNVEKLGEIFEIHRLALEDIVNTTHHPKAEKYDGSLFIVLKHLNFDEDALTVRADQISVYTRKTEVVSFLESPSEVFQPIIDRLKSADPKNHKITADYLTYSLLDAVVDDYYLTLEKIGGQIEILEDEILRSPSPQIMNKIYRLKSSLYFARRQIAPLREAVNSFISLDFEVFDKSTFFYLRDVYDHIIQILDSIDIYREILSSLIDIHLSASGNRMNEIMKVLTIIATIFIPLTFLAGVYGMNFHFMPELNWKYGYIALWGFMLAVALLMLYLFKKKKWF